ncbi:D-2-hydroxyglutarate dehydrogenase, mitochondrial isoform X1 [Planococcus citri]|uniref:D-2-hydroxyglutarate dehydrogenase, mitochondrial isoform X1 n=1 Tax=Planococcus citri TaxID=170843 RepID=UPI0031F79CB1
MIRHDVFQLFPSISIGGTMKRLIRRFSTLTKDRYPDLKRGSFSSLQDKDVQFFESILNKNQVITDADEVQSYNIDWLKANCGYSSIVLKPRTTEQVSAILKHCNERKLAVCPQGGNTGLVGGGVPVFDEIIISTSLMNKIINLNTLTGVLTCQSGCVLESLSNHLKDHGFIMPIDLGAKGSCQIGGNVSTNAGGLRLLRYGSLHSTVLGVQAVLANGDVVDCMNTLKKDNTGYHLKHLFIGSEGTLGLVTEVAIQCPPLPKATNLALLGLSSFEQVLNAFKLARGNLAEILSSCELMDQDSVKVVEKNLGLTCPLPNMPFYMLIETSGSNMSHDEEKLNMFLETCLEQKVILDGFATSEPSKMKVLWDIRERITGALLKDGYSYKYDVSLPLNVFYDIILEFRERLKDLNQVKTICGYGHLGDGNLHVNMTSSEYDEKIKKTIEPFIYEWISKHRGSISAEHGVGFLKSKYLHFSKTQKEIDMMKSLKSNMDPNGIMNPYKVLF